MPDEIALMTQEEIDQAVANQVDRVASAGVPVAVDPDDAEAMGAFFDDALDLADALDSRFDDVAEGE